MENSQERIETPRVPNYPKSYRTYADAKSMHESQEKKCTTPKSAQETPREKMCELTRCPHCGLRLDDPDWLEIARIRQQIMGLKVKYWPYRNHLTADELCQQSGLTSAQFEALAAARLLNADDSGGRYYRRKLVGWAKKLAYLLNEDWTVTEIKRWSRERWHTDNPRQWPPERKNWQGS